MRHEQQPIQFIMSNQSGTVGNESSYGVVVYNRLLAPASIECVQTDSLLFVVPLCDTGDDDASCAAPDLTAADNCVVSVES